MYGASLIDFAPFGPIADQAGEFQQTQVLRHRRLRHAGILGQGAHGLLSVPSQALEDRATGPIGEDLEEVVRCGLHGGIIALRL